MMQVATLSEEDKTDLNRLFKLEINELYAEFAQDIGDLGVMDDIKEAVDNWLSQRRTKLYNLICIQNKYCEFISVRKNASQLEIAGAVADIIAPLCMGGLPINTLAVLLVRTYLYNLCQCNL